MDCVNIPLSKRKLWLMLIGSVLFVVLGACFLISPGSFVTQGRQPGPLIFIVSTAAIIFFGITAITYLKKLLDTRPGLVIDEQGITDNSSGVSGGRIGWDEITGIKQAEGQNQRFILLMVTDPEKRIEAEPGFFKKRMMKINYRMYKTPVCITANGLESTFNELYEALQHAFKEYKKA